MRAVSPKLLRPGMVVASRVFPPGDESAIPLLAPGVVITDAIIQRLLKTTVRSVVVDDEYSRGIDAEIVVSDDARREAIVSIRGAFDAAARSSGDVVALNPSHVSNVNSSLSAIMAELSWRKNLMTGLSDLNRFGGDRLQRAVNVCVLGVTIGRRYLERWGWKDYRDNPRRDLFDERVQRLGLGLMLADVGMLAVPAALWNADPATLADDDRRMLEQHPIDGVELLRETGADLSALTTIAIVQHHERVDGSGYPRGLTGEDMHEHGKIAAVADAYVSMTSAGQVDGDGSSPRRPLLAPHEAWARIVGAAGSLYDDRVVEAFRETVAPFSPGATVRLNDGRYAIVADHSAAADRPHVRVTHAADGQPLAVPEQVDLSTQGDAGLEIVEATAGLPTDGW